MSRWLTIAVPLYYIICNVFCAPHNVTLSDIKDNNATTNTTLYLHYKNIENHCNATNQKSICESESIRVCAGRLINNTKTGDLVYEKKEFKNACYLLLSNACENANNPYYIISSGVCVGNSSSASHKISAQRKAFKSLYKKEVVPFCYPEHRCPLSCPNVYKPICLNINRDENKYMKIYYFMNHCLGDVFYCTHPEEFARPPAERNTAKTDSSDEELDVRTSQLSWSDCAHSKFTAFSRFTEVASSMGRYGWLAGDYHASRILEPHERLPEFGAPVRKLRGTP